MTIFEHDHHDRAALLAKISALQAVIRDASRADRAKSLFWAAIAHDLTQPVQSLVLLSAYLEKQKADLPEAAAKTIAAVKSAVAGLQGLLAAIDLERLDIVGGAPALKSVDLAEILRQLSMEYGLRAAARGLKLRLASRPICARADADILARILRNLIENALRYTPTGGVLIGVRRRVDKARIDIVDTGVGISAKNHAEIFQEFHRLSHTDHDVDQGAGLGLAIVAKLAGQIGATIEVVSEPGRGSRFSLSLPLIDAPGPVSSPLTTVSSPLTKD
jgi:signal transduction histidine kinase